MCFNPITALFRTDLIVPHRYHTHTTFFKGPEKRTLILTHVTPLYWPSMQTPPTHPRSPHWLLARQLALTSGMWSEVVHAQGTSQGLDDFFCLCHEKVMTQLWAASSTGSHNGEDSWRELHVAQTPVVTWVGNNLSLGSTEIFPCSLHSTA
jgi:hypothetical protein